MNTGLRTAMSLLVALFLVGCASLGEISGQKVEGATKASPMQRVDVVFLDQQSLQRANPVLGVLAPPVRVDSFMEDSVHRQLREAFEQAVRGVQDAFAQHAIPGRAFLQSKRPSDAVHTPSHVVFLSLRKATVDQFSTLITTVDVVVYEPRSKQILWKGETRLMSGPKVSAKGTHEMREAVGNGVLRALNESGIAPAATVSAWSK